MLKNVHQKRIYKTKCTMGNSIFSSILTFLLTTYFARGIPKVSKFTLANLTTRPEQDPASQEHNKSAGSVCAVVKLAEGKNITLVENGVLDRSQYESVHEGKLKDARFSVISHSHGICMLEICGFNSLSVDPYKYGSCEWYSTGSTWAPGIIYNVSILEVKMKYLILM